MKAESKKKKNTNFTNSLNRFAGKKKKIKKRLYSSQTRYAFKSQREKQ